MPSVSSAAHLSEDGATIWTGLSRDPPQPGVGSSLSHGHRNWRGPPRSTSGSRWPRALTLAPRPYAPSPLPGESPRRPCTTSRDSSGSPRVGIPWHSVVLLRRTRCRSSGLHGLLPNASARPHHTSNTWPGATCGGRAEHTAPARPQRGISATCRTASRTGHRVMLPPGSHESQDQPAWSSDPERTRPRSPGPTIPGPGPGDRSEGP